MQFKIEELSQEQRLNGFEFKATAPVQPGPFRWWIAEDKAWRDWQVGEIAPPVILIKKKGVWSHEMAPNRYESRKPLTTCSQIPSSQLNARTAVIYDHRPTA
jgi:hypothetical protein